MGRLIIWLIWRSETTLGKNFSEALKSFYFCLRLHKVAPPRGLDSLLSFWLSLWGLRRWSSWIDCTGRQRLKRRIHKTCWNNVEIIGGWSLSDWRVDMNESFEKSNHYQKRKKGIAFHQEDIAIRCSLVELKERPECFKASPYGTDFWYVNTIIPIRQVLGQ